SSRILFVSNWNNPILRDKPERRFQTDDVLDSRWPGNRSVCLCPDCYRAQICRSAVTRTRTRSPRCITQVVGIVRTPTARAPTDGERIGLSLIVPEIRPLAQIRFAKNYCASFTQLLNDHSISRHAAMDQRKRPCRRFHVVIGCDVILDQNGNPMKRATNVTAA